MPTDLSYLVEVVDYYCLQHDFALHQFYIGFSFVPSEIDPAHNAGMIQNVSVLHVIHSWKKRTLVRVLMHS